MQETVVKQSQESLSSLPVLYKRDDFQSIQWNPIQGAIQLWATLNEKDTVVIYQQAAAKTWELFKQAIAVIFFLFRLLIALIIWVCGIAFQSGLNFRNWLEIKQPTLDEIVSALFKVFVWSLNHAYEWAASFIKKYLGWEIKFDHLTAKSPAMKPEETPAFPASSSESSSEKSKNGWKPLGDITVEERGKGKREEKIFISLLVYAVHDGYLIVALDKYLAYV